MTSAGPALPHAQYERFDGGAAYDRMFDELAAYTQRFIRVFDSALSPAYNTPARCDLLRAFLRGNPTSRLLIVLHDTSGVQRTCPRFVNLLQQWGHAVQVRQTPRSARRVYDAFSVFDASHYLHRFHADQMRFSRGTNELVGTQHLLERFEELWEVSTPAAATRVLGL